MLTNEANRSRQHAADGADIAGSGGQPATQPPSCGRVYAGPVEERPRRLFRPSRANPGTIRIAPPEASSAMHTWPPHGCGVLAQKLQARNLG